MFFAPTKIDIVAASGALRLNFFGGTVSTRFLIGVGLCLCATALPAQTVTISNVTNINGTPASNIVYDLSKQPTAYTLTNTGTALVSGSSGFHTNNVSGGNNLRPTSMRCASGAGACTSGQWGSVVLASGAQRSSLELTYGNGLYNSAGSDLFVFENGTVPTTSELFYTSVFANGAWSSMRYVLPTQMNAVSSTSTGFYTFIDFSWFGLANGAQIDRVLFTGGQADDRGTFDAATGTWVIPPDFTSGSVALTNAQGNAFGSGDYDADILFVGVLSSAPSSSVVPEPSTYALMAAGLAGVFAVNRRRRQQRNS